MAPQQQQMMVQPMVQPTVAAQPRPSIAYSYGYPSTGEIKSTKYMKPWMARGKLLFSVSLVLY